MIDIDFAAEPIVLASRKERSEEKASLLLHAFQYEELEMTDWERQGSRASIETKQLDGSPSWGTNARWPVDKPVGYPGARIRAYGGFGQVLRGVDLLVGKEWVEIFFQTKDEVLAEHGAWVAQHQQEQRRQFEKSKSQLDAIYDDLPTPLKRRINRFRAEDPDFRWRDEAYEMAACAEAGRLYQRAMDPEFGKALRAGGWKGPKPEVLATKKPSYEWEEGDGTLEWEDTPEMRLRVFDAINSKLNGYQYKAMDELMPEMDKGHSGNTWGHAFMFALKLIRDGDNAQL